MKSLLKCPIIAILLCYSLGFTEPTKPDAEQPLKIESAIVEFNDQNGIATYTDNVVANQGSRHLTADKLIIYRGKNNKIDMIIAIGKPAHFQFQPDPTKPISFGHADTIKHFPNEDKVCLIGNAQLEKDGNIIKGHFLTYFFESGLLRSEPSPQKRTTVILKPKQTNQ